MTREESERLNKLRDEGHEIYSISRLDSINGCLYGAYRTYVLNERGNGNVYSSLGSKVHDTLEAIVNGDKDESALMPALMSELSDLDLFGVDFPKDRNGGTSIRDGWIANMKHFCTNYKKPDGNYETEKLIVYKSPKGRYLQGYIDLTEINNDGTIGIYDYKTSSMYKGEELLKHGRQLLIYAAGKMQDGFNVKSVNWNFLKYATVSIYGKKTARSKDKTWICKNVERRKIGAELERYVIDDLYNIGVDEMDIDVVVDELRRTNSIDVLPDAIRGNYKIADCIVNYEITDKLIEECGKYVDDTIDMWEQLDRSDPSCYGHRPFIKTSKTGNTSSDIFFCTSLCDHYKKCPHIEAFIKTLDINNKDDEEDIF